MLSRENFIQSSLEINLFFQRIMKEHMFFIETHLPPNETALISEANILKESFEVILAETVMLANGNISNESIKSNKFVTKFTLPAEEVTSALSGASINTDITKDELELVGTHKPNYTEWLDNAVDGINERSMNLLEEVIAYKSKVLKLVLECKIAIMLYPEMLKHIIEEAENYAEILKCLRVRKLPQYTPCEELNFWNHIMEEHGEFIDGMLDPTEEELKEIAKKFVERFDKLVKECIKTREMIIIQKSLKTAKGIRDYKIASTEGLLECKIKSIIPPLLADHVLREANYYINILKYKN